MCGPLRYGRPGAARNSGKDIEFTTDPARATTSVYWELVHGGVSRPANTYSVNAQFPLEAAGTYYWRVRPRVRATGPRPLVQHLVLQDAVR